MTGTNSGAVWRRSLARIRTIKPGFFKNEQLAELSFAHRLLFVGLWTQADREGRLEDRPRRLKAELFPYDDVDVSAMLQDMATAELIARYEVDGTSYIWIPKFLDHQRPHYSEPPSTYPAVDVGLTHAAEISAATAEIVVPATLGREGSEEGKGKEWRGMLAPFHARSGGGLVNGTDQRRHGTHEWCDHERSMCVPFGLHGQFVNRLGTPNASELLREWYPTVIASYRGRQIGDPLFRFWDNAFSAWVGNVTSTASHGKGNQSRDAMQRAIQRRAAAQETR